MSNKSPKKETAKGKGAAKAVSSEILLRMYRNVYVTRQFELKCMDLYRQGFIRGYLHPYLGEEAIAAGACEALRPDDYIVSTHRGHGHCISKGADLKMMFAEILGRETGYCKGRGGSMHIFSKENNNLGANGIVAAGIPIGTGAAMGIKVRKSDQVVVVFFSDGAANQGLFPESMNFASAFNLPVIFMLENNHYAVSTPVECSFGNCDLACKGPAFGIPGVCVEGNDAVEVYAATKSAVQRARSGEGPTLIEAKTYRHGGHHVNDPGLYMDQELLAQWKAKDPLDILKMKINDKNKLTTMEEEMDRKLDEAEEFAKNSPQPSVDAFLASIPNF
ncbi:MAG: thiamine pyrophosphate-dependent dehydrogenase E1 component subunit alpha [Deltaproteobacteria bacterium]|nr:thiamine pyrophosphate-dependent dehydrogenase E1 component subunit alpha [Deltaproteobacteria bacterium]